MQAIDVESEFKIAVQEHLNNNFQSAHDLYKIILAAEPSNKDVNYLLGILYLQNGFISQGNEQIQAAGNASDLNTSNGFFSNSHNFKYGNEKENDFSQKTEAVGVFNEDTIGAWRHHRMVEYLNVFNKDSKWLTVGDFCGRDSWMLTNMGYTNVIASNLYIDALEQSSKVNHISKYMEVNAESMDLPDDSVDYILCKEALHHMPRPYMAIYEMLRVAKKGVFFVEPQDSLIDWKVSDNKIAYRDFITDPLLGQKISYKLHSNGSEIHQSAIDWWESDARNYVYTLSKREIRKIALGMGLPSFAYKCFNDYYQSDIDQDPPIHGTPSFDRVLEQLSLHNQLCEAIGKPHGYISGAFFKESPSSELAQKLRDFGFEFNYTPSRYISIKWPKIPNLF